MNQPKVILNLWRFAQVIIFFLVNKHVVEPYMDEVFHVPQAQIYCHNKFGQYDPKLTTPPGLYLLSWCVHQFGFPCSIEYLRLINLFVGTLLLPGLCSRIFKQRNPAADALEIEWARCIAIMPLFSFFSFLYYTDLASTYLVLQSYLLVLQKQYVKGSCVGFLSLWFRQTNFIWVCVFAAIAVLQAVQTHREADRLELALCETSFSDLLREISDLLPRLLNQWPMVLRIVAIFIPSIILATGFLLWNGSIVLGDKQMHQAGLFPIQIFYMICFVSAVSWPIYLDLNTLHSSLALFRWPITILAIICGSTYAAQYKEFQHAFILSDNRHYTFYVNRRLVQPLSPGLISVIFSLLTTFFMARLTRTPTLQLLLLIAATTATLVPTSLLEFRYYLIPYVLWRFEAGTPRVSDHLKTLEITCWVMIHWATIYLFLAKPFNWPGSTTMQRFMW